MTPDGFRRLALSLPEAIESAHMGHPDFRVGGRIFATLGSPDSSHGMVKLKPDQQAKVKAAFDKHMDEIWTYSEELFKDALNCNAGVDPCTTGKKFKLVNVQPGPADSELIRSAVTKVSYPAWSEVCDKSNAGCAQKWTAAVAPVLGLK